MTSLTVYARSFKVDPFPDDASKKLPLPSALPVSDKPVTLNFNKAGAASKAMASVSGPKGPAAVSLAFSADDFAAGDDDQGTEQAVLAEDDKGTIFG